MNILFNPIARLVPSTNTKWLTHGVAQAGMFLILLWAQAAAAATYVVTNAAAQGAGSLLAAMLLAQSDTNAVINVATGMENITLTGPLPEIENNLILNGNGDLISGTGTFRIFFVNAPGATVEINALTLNNGLAEGGTGGSGYGGGGGGAGLGGAIYLNAGTLTVKGVNFMGNTAYGGAGGIGFDDDLNSTLGGGGGGGGLNYGGGQSEGGTSDNGQTYEGPGGGGGALSSPGTAGDPNRSQAGTGGGVNGGQGGALSVSGSGGPGGSPSLPDGGGGGGGLSVDTYGDGGNGGNGSDFGGGGGAGSSDEGNSGSGGSGGFGGGGGGGAFTPTGVGLAGGTGGFGGGGGGGGEGMANNASGGASGFGGGSGASGAAGNGGGGLGAGGAIFARTGSGLTIQDCTFSGDAVAGGGAASLATGGSASGQAIFLGGNVNYAVTSGTNTLTETLGGGNDSNAEGTFSKSGMGKLVLTKAESYFGSTTVNDGTLEVSNNILPSSAINISSGAVLEYNWAARVLTPNETYTGTGILRATGQGNVVFGPGVINVDFSPGALIDVQSGFFTGSSSYGGKWASNYAALNIDSGATFDAVEAGLTGTMQIDALMGAGIFQGGYFGNADYGLTTVTMGVAGGSGIFSGTIQDDAGARLGLVKVGAGTEITAGTNTYSGGTTVSNGVFVINGTGGSGPVDVYGGMLEGTGSIAGEVLVGPAGTLAPGMPGAILTINSGLTLEGNTLITLEGGSASQVAVLDSVTFGGTLTITNLGGPLTSGQTFTLFSAGATTGNFMNIAGEAGNGLLFNFDPSNGVLHVISTLPTAPTTLTYAIRPGEITLAWPANDTGWILQAQTNSTGLGTNWVDVAGSAAVNSWEFPVSTSHSVFFRMRHP